MMEKIKYLVADTTAFINNVQLNEYAEIILTVPDVINEVKNKRQVRRLVVLPFDLKIQEPTNESMTFVSNFAKNTGDFASLSIIDLKIIALTYDLEVKYKGSDHLRTSAILSKVIASKDKPEEFLHDSIQPGFFFHDENANKQNVLCSENQRETEEIDRIENGADNKPLLCNDEFTKSASKEKEISLLVENMSVKIDKLEHTEKLKGDFTIEKSEINQDSDDDNNTWITPTNIQNKNKSFGKNVSNSVPTVACITTDYAIQNVLKQINLNICSLNGRVIKHMRTYILRCYSCFKTTSIMTKNFCPNCGNKTLKRVAVSLNDKGEQVVHINIRRPLTTKYKNQSLQRPRGGKHSRNPILVEDQPIPKQMPSRVAKTKTNSLDDDYITGFSPFVTRDVSSKSALLRAKGNVKEWARNNIYEENRRKKSFNKLVK